MLQNLSALRGALAITIFPDQGGHSSQFSFTEHEAIIRVMQLLSHTGSDPTIPMEEVNAIMVALGNGGILHSNVPSTSSGQTTFLTATLHAAGITADHAALLLSSGWPVPAQNFGGLLVHAPLPSLSGM